MNSLKYVKLGLCFDGNGLSKYIQEFAASFIKNNPDTTPNRFIDRCKEEIEDVMLNFCTLNQLPNDEVSAILERNSHLDATHVGIIGNPYFYVCLGGLDYCFQDGEWALCDWSESELGNKDNFTPIKFGE